jgi:nitrogen fixation protein NifU and related proteins
LRKYWARNMTELYAELLLEAAKHPSHYGLVDQENMSGGSLNASCGDQISLTGKITNDILTDLKWQGKGCIISRAHMDGLAQRAIGQSLTQILSFSKSDMLQLFGFDDKLAPGREKCLMIGLIALHEAVIKYQKNQK